MDSKSCRIASAEESRSQEILLSAQFAPLHRRENKRAATVEIPMTSILSSFFRPVFFLLLAVSTSVRKIG